MLPELESDEVAEAAHTIRDACKQIRFEEADVVVVVSPHGRATGVYRTKTGSLDAFGTSGIAAQGADDIETSEELAHLATLDLLHDQADHGIVVASRLLACDSPVVAVGFAETQSLDETREGAQSMSRALRALSSHRNVAVVASVNGSAGLSPRAPLSELRGARQVEDRLQVALETDCGQVAPLARELRESAGSCAQAPLEILAGLFGGRRGRVLAHEAPVGVGYIVASVDGG